MATITDELVLDISQPLRQFDQLEGSLDDSVTSARRLSEEMDNTERATAEAARAEADDVDEDAADTTRPDNEAYALDWMRAVFAALSEQPLPDSNDDLPLWMTNPALPRQLTEHWRSVPQVPGVR